MVPLALRTPAALAAAMLVLTAAPALAESISKAGASVAVTASGQKVSVAGANVVVTGEAKKVNAAGANVSVKANVADSVRAAGAEVTFEGTAGGEIQVLGARVTLRGKAGKDIWTGGATVDADIATPGNLKTAGGKVTLGPATDVGGSLYVGGGEVSVAGHVAGEARLAGGRVVFDAKADKTVTIEAEELTIGPNAVIAGDLVLVGDTTATVDPLAKVAGQTRKIEAKDWWSGPKVDPRPGRFGFALFIAGTAILAGLGLLLLGRASFDEAASLARNRPGMSFIVGLVTLVLIPILALALCVTLVGIPIGISFVLLVPLLLIIGHATFALGAADWIFNRTGLPRTVGRSILFLVVGAIGTAIAGIIPVIGPFIVFVALLLGLGAFLATLRHRLTSPGGV